MLVGYRTAANQHIADALRESMRDRFAGSSELEADKAYALASKIRTLSTSIDDGIAAVHAARGSSAPTKGSRAELQEGWALLAVGFAAFDACLPVPICGAGKRLVDDQLVGGASSAGVAVVEVKNYISKALLSLADQAEMARRDGLAPLPSFTEACADRERMLMLSMFRAAAREGRPPQRSRSPKRGGRGNDKKSDGARRNGNRGGKGDRRRSRSRDRKPSPKRGRSRSPRRRSRSQDRKKQGRSRSPAKGKCLWVMRPADLSTEKSKALQAAVKEKFPKLCFWFAAGAKGCSNKDCKAEHPRELPQGFMAICRKVGADSG